MTIRRTFVILVLLAIVFFVYRGISPSGADQLLLNIKNIPVRLWLLSGELISSPLVSSGAIVSSWTVTSGAISLSWTIATGATISTGKVLTGKAIVFSSTLNSGWTFALEALVIPPQNTTTIIEPTTTWWSLIIVQSPDSIPLGVSHTPTVVKKPSVTTKPLWSRSLTQDIALLNNLFK